jgi:galactonate dehydratase
MRLEGPQQHSVGGKLGRRLMKLIVRVDADNGLYGLGEADDFLGVRDAIEYIKSCLVGRSTLDVCPFVSEMLYGTLPPHPVNARYDGRKFEPRVVSLFGVPVALCSPTATPTGPIAWGMSGVEMALCDLVGKTLGTPVYNLLGGKYRDKVRIYLDRSAPSDSATLAAWERMAQEAAELGFAHMKFDVEYIAPEYTQDVWNRSLTTQQLRQIYERLNAVRKTVGWDAEICVDAHMHYNASDAIRLSRELAPLRLVWLEDPTPITNPDACAMVKENSSIPICVGEMFIAEQCRLFIDRDACDIIHPDVMFSGGLHETKRIADYAELHYMPTALHSNGGALATIAAAHVAAASRSFLGLEYHHIESTWINQFVRREGVSLFKDGYLHLTDAPGLGVELDRDVCQQFLFSGEMLL